MNKKKTLKKMDALLCIPGKNTLVKETHLDSGDLVLAYPSEYKPFFLKLKKVVSRNSPSFFVRKIQLDSLGKDVWTLIDGKKNVKSIINTFAALHTLNYKESEISVTQFLRSLGEKGLIGIKDPTDD